MGVDGLVICLKDDGVYRWKSMDGKNTSLKPPNWSSSAVLTNINLDRIRIILFILQL